MKPIAPSGSLSNTLFQGFAASDLWDRRDQERRPAGASRLKDVLAKKQRDKKKGRPIEALEDQIESLRERLRGLKGRK